ncbi:MAG: hypothetical protein ACREJD_09520 [Phycisphaerales bacterium]
MRNTHTDPLLFAPPPAFNTSRTSQEAAAQAAPKAATKRQRILECIAALGEFGGTIDKIASITKFNIDTVKARVHQLGQTGLVRALAKPGKSKAGKPAFVFVTAEAAAEAAAGHELEPWPLPRKDWKAEAIANERRAIDAEQRCMELTQQLAAREGVSQ